MKPSGHRLIFDAPGIYRIRVQGCVAAHWSDMLGGMTISVRQAAGKPPVTTLSGELTDQASLMGVLSALYEMHFTLLDVKRLSDPEIVEVADGQVSA